MAYRALSIGTKLVAFIGVLVCGIVVLLTVYFSSSHLAEIDRRLLDKVNAYSALVAKQLEPAIAFQDRETAREVLESLRVDHDLIGAALYTSDGRALVTIGIAPRPRRASTVVVDSGVVVTLPIVAHEGPTGTLVIELSTAAVRTHTRAVTMTAVAVGATMLLIGALAAWLIARSLARRLTRIANLATAVAEGALDVAPLDDASPDEIGVLARGFDTMVARLRVVIADIQRMADAEQALMSGIQADLERGIAARTQALSQANVDLKHEISARAAIEVELRHAQKLESVGRLAAGIAHELNTPIQFITDSCTFLREAIPILIALGRENHEILAAVEAGAQSPNEALARLAVAEDAADLEYIAQQLPLAADRALDGLGRMATIVRSMKEFSHPGGAEPGPADLNRALTNTIEISRSEHNRFAEITVDLGELPAVCCRVGELNQAFLNILVNAAHAIGDRMQGGERGTIAIRTWVDGPDVKISIRDTGGGIPDAIREQIFEPFFTTKELGRGTGQGLAIVRSIVVDKHGGSIAVDSVMGEGTTFTISLPIDGRGTPDGSAAEGRRGSIDGRGTLDGSAAEAA